MLTNILLFAVGGRVMVLAIYLGMLITLASAALCVSYFSYSFYSISPDASVFPRFLHEDIEIYKVSTNRSVIIACLFVAILTLYICV